MLTYGKRLLALLTLISFIVYSSNYDIGGGGGTVPGPMIGGTEGSVLFINPNDTVDQDNANLHFDTVNDALGIQTSTPYAALHVVGATGSQINSVTTASVVGANETLDTSPTGSVTLIAEFGALTISSVSQNTSGSGYVASGQTIDYQVSQCVQGYNSSYYCSNTVQTASFTDPLNDASNFSVDLSFSSINAETTYLLILKQVNGGGYNDSVIIPVASSYEDTAFSGSASYATWPTSYVLSYTTPTAPSGMSGSETNIGSGALTANGTTYNFEIRSCANVNSVYYCEQTGTSGSFTDGNGANTFDLQIDYTAGAGDDQVIRISSDGGTTWSYHFTGSGAATQYIWNNPGNNGSAQTAWSNDIASAQVQYAFKAYGKTTAPSGNVVFSPTANTYYATITTPNVYYIFKHTYTGFPSGGARVLGDYNTGVTNGLDIVGNFYDFGYTNWANGTTVTPTTYAFSNGTTRYFRLVGYSGTIYSPTPLNINATTSGSQYFSGSFSYPSGVTQVKILVSTDGVTFSGSKTFASPTATFTYDSTDNSWNQNTTITPTATVPTTGRFDKNLTSLTSDAPQLSIVENSASSGLRYSSIGFGIASGTGVLYQSNIASYSNTGYLGVGASRLVGYANTAQGTQTWSLGSANELNSNKSSSTHTTIWGGGASTEPLAYFFSAGDNNRGTMYMGNDGLTGTISDAKLVISPEAGGTTGLVFNRPSGSSSGNVLRIESSGSYLGGIGPDSSVFINRTTPDTNAFLSFGGSATKAAIKFGGTLKSTPTALGLEASSDDLYFTITTGATREKVTLSDINLTTNRIPFATTNGRLTDDADLTFSTDRLTATKMTTTLDTHTASAAPGSPAEGDVWNDSTQKALMGFISGVKQAFVGTLFTQTATGTVANTTTETAITSTGVGTLTLPANFFAVGKSLRISGKGLHSSAANPDITIRVKLGSTTILTTGAVPSSADTDAQFDIEGMITARTIGASGTIMAQGHYEEDGTSPDTFQMTNTSTTTIDTTASQTLSITAQWSAASASNTISLTNLTVEVLN